jgi:hypothetical protein
MGNKTKAISKYDKQMPIKPKDLNQKFIKSIADLSGIKSDSLSTSKKIIGFIISK